MSDELKTLTIGGVSKNILEFVEGNNIELAEDGTDPNKRIITADLSDYYNSTSVDTMMDLKVDKETGKGLSSNDYTNADKAVIDGLPDALADKVDKVTGKGLSANDFTDAYKDQLDDVPTTYATKTELEDGLDEKQDVLTAGTNITIASDGTISATDTTYTAGENIDISASNVISADVPVYTGAGIVSVNSNHVISADMSDYYPSSRLYTKEEINAMIGNGIEFAPVATLPATGESSKVYLLETTDPDVRDMYVWDNGTNTYTKVGSTSVSLQGVVKTTGSRETYDEHTITVWQEDGRVMKLTILGIGWVEASIIASNDGLNSGSAGANAGGAVTP